MTDTIDTTAIRGALQTVFEYAMAEALASAWWPQITRVVTHHDGAPLREVAAPSLRADAPEQILIHWAREMGRQAALFPQSQIERLMGRPGRPDGYGPDSFVYVLPEPFRIEYDDAWRMVGRCALVEV